MSAAKSSRKRNTNLYLSLEALRQAKALKKKLNRPSVSNVIEFLLAEANKPKALAA